MARIPTYVSDSLASRRVGTPGMDRSAFMQAATGNEQAAAAAQESIYQTSTIAGAIGDIGKTFFNAVGKELRYQKNQARMQQRQLAAAQQQAKIAKYDLEQDKQLDVIFNESKSANVNTPGAATEQYSQAASQSGQKLIDTWYNTKQIDDMTKARLEQRLYTRMSGDNRQLSAWGENQTNENIRAEAEYQRKTLADGAATVDDLYKVTQQSNQFFGKQAAVLGDNQALRLTMGVRRDAALNVLAYTAEHTPEKMEEVLKDPIFGESDISTKDRERAIDAAASEIKTRETEKRQVLASKNGEMIAGLDSMKWQLEGNEDRGVAKAVADQGAKILKPYLSMKPEERQQFEPFIKQVMGLVHKANGQVKSIDKEVEREARSARAEERSIRASERAASASERAAAAAERADAERARKEKLNSNDAINRRDDISTLTKLLPSVDQINNPKAKINVDQSIEFANEIINRVDQARNLGLATESQTAAEVSTARAALIALNRRAESRRNPQAREQMARDAAAPSLSDRKNNFLVKTSAPKEVIDAVQARTPEQRKKLDDLYRADLREATERFERRNKVEFDPSIKAHSDAITRGVNSTRSAKGLK